MLGRLIPLNCAVILLVGLFGCGAAPDSGAQPETNRGAMAMARGSHDTAAGGQLLPEERFATALATVVGVNSEGAEITLDHEPLEAIGMGAMTMAFAVADDVDLGVIAAGNRVAVRIRQRKNYSYELLALCRTDEESVDCLQ